MALFTLPHEILALIIVPLPLRDWVQVTQLVCHELVAITSHFPKSASRLALSNWVTELRSQPQPLTTLAGSIGHSNDDLVEAIAYFINRGASDVNGGLCRAARFDNTCLVDLFIMYGGDDY